MAIKILHIISYPRSGSTILGLALDQYKGITYLGELSALFTHTWHRPCTCGVNESIHVNDCELWNPILKEAKLVLQSNQLWDSENPGLSRELRKDFLKKAAIELRNGEETPTVDIIEKILKIVYLGSSKKENSDLIVDSSKDLNYLKIVQRCFKEDYIPLHLFRDSRAVVYSGRKNPSVPGKATALSNYRSAKIALGWGAKNLLIKKIIGQSKGKKYTLLYEDWCLSPKKITDQLVEKIKNKEILESPFFSKNTFKIESPCHSFFGNRSRKSSGEITIKSDKAWIKGLDKNFKGISTIASFPFLKMFGYKL